MKLGVNVDHVATLRQARHEQVPDPVAAAVEAIKGGADGITAHLREDRRHIQDKDMIRLKNEIEAPLNMEMAAVEEIIQTALKVRPSWVCLVPEKRTELTTEGGLLIGSNRGHVYETIKRMHDVGIRVSLFIEPDKRVIELSKEIGADAVELHTGVYGNLWGTGQAKELERIKEAALHGQTCGIIVNAGHGITYDNVSKLTQAFEFNELNIGFSIMARAMFVGIKQAVSEMKNKMKRGS